MGDRLAETRLDSEYTDDGRAFAIPVQVRQIEPWQIDIDFGRDASHHGDPLATVTIMLGSDGKITAWLEQQPKFREGEPMEIVEGAEFVVLPFSRPVTTNPETIEGTVSDG